MGQTAAYFDYPQKGESVKTITRLRGKPLDAVARRVHCVRWTDGHEHPDQVRKAARVILEGSPGWTEATADIRLPPIPGILSLAIGHGDRLSRWRLLAVQYPLDFDHLQDSQIGSLSLKQKNRIVIGGILWNQDESLRCGTTFGTSRKR